MLPISNFKKLGLSSGGIALVIVLILVIPAEEKTDHMIEIIQEELKQNEISMAVSDEKILAEEKEIILMKELLQELCKDSNRC